jgi:hypothetical protein
MQKGLIVTIPAKFFAASVLALAITGIAASGFKAITSGAETYRRAVEFSQNQLSSTPKLMPIKDHDDPQILQSRFIFAWVLGVNCIINRVRSTHIDPWALLKKELAGAEWTRPISLYPKDEDVITVIIKMPEAPWEAIPVLSAVRRHSFLFAVEDGSGSLSLANTFFGMGLS